MAKIILKMVVMLVVVVGVSNYALYIMTGKTPFSTNNLKMPDISAPSVDSLVNGGKTTAYKWTDENGVVHYSSEPPPEHRQVEVLEVDPNVNLVQGVEKKEEIAGPGSQGPGSQPALDLPGGNVYSPENVQKLIQDAKDVQQKLNERYKEQEKIVGGEYD